MRCSPPGPWLAEVLAGHRPGELIQLPWPHIINGQEFTHAVVEKDFKTKSRAQLLRFLPGDAFFILKIEDIRKELAVMKVLQRMNARWQQRGIEVCGLPVGVITYSIIPLGAEAGLVEVVPRSWTLRELAQTCSSEERQWRVLRTLQHDAGCLDKLAATLVGYLTAGYALGVRDSHDDNIMLRADGALFRVDFGFIFGATPEIDAPQTIVPLAVSTALSPSRWDEVVGTSGKALAALNGDATNCPPAWDCVTAIPEMEPLLKTAYSHASTLSVEEFCQAVRCANEWSFSRAAKNSLREILRYISIENPLGPGGEAEAASCDSSPNGQSDDRGKRSPGPLPLGRGRSLAPDDPFAPGPPPLPPGDPFAPAPAEEGTEQDSELRPSAQPGPLPPGDPFASQAAPSGPAEQHPFLNACTSLPGLSGPAFALRSGLAAALPRHGAPAGQLLGAASLGMAQAPRPAAPPSWLPPERGLPSSLPDLALRLGTGLS